MPLLSIETNQDHVNLRALLAEASGLAAKLLGKPERYVMVRLNVNPQLWFGGTDAPAAFLQLKSIGLPQDTSALSQALCDFIETQLKVPKARVYIEFTDVQRQLWGWDSGTF